MRMAQVQGPSMTIPESPDRNQIQSEREQELQQPQSRLQQQRQNDDSWLRTPPGGPQLMDKQAAMELDAAAVSLSPQPAKPVRSTHAFALDDLEAAETLAGFARQSSPPAKNTVPTAPFPTYQSTPPAAAAPQPEPLLSLLTSQHPLIGSAISGSLSAYNVGKTYSSQFRYGAEFVERNIASPVASTVGTAGRITGVENGVRRWLSRGRDLQNEGEPSNAGASRSPDAAAMSPSSSNNSHKRRRDDNDSEAEPGQPAQRSRAASELSLSNGEFLPAYDANRSPTYSSRDPYPPLSPQQHNLGSSTWQTRLILSTSGLGVAMSGESRRSLKYCLNWLRWGNGRLGRLVYSLQALLVEYEMVGQQQQQNGQNGQAATGAHMQPRDQAAITAQLATLKVECEKVLKKSVDVVSKYTGGALPDNARALVHRHLTSLPQRFAFALRGERDILGDEEEQASAMLIENGSHDGSLAENGAAENGGTSASDRSETERRRDTVRAAKRMVVLAREGLEMMGQVSLVIDSTIKSAEEWCERLGRRIPEGEDAEVGQMDVEGASPEGIPVEGLPVGAIPERSLQNGAARENTGGASAGDHEMENGSN